MYKGESKETAKAKILKQQRAYIIEEYYITTDDIDDDDREEELQPIIELSNDDQEDSPILFIKAIKEVDGEALISKVLQ